MTWWTYVQEVAGRDDQATIARRAGVQQSMVSRWKSSLPKPENAAAFARSYGRPVLEAFVAAGFLSPDEAKERPSAPPSLASLTDDDLVNEVRRRMKGAHDAGNADAEKRDDDEGGSVVDGPWGDPPKSPPGTVRRAARKGRPRTEGDDHVE